MNVSPQCKHVTIWRGRCQKDAGDDGYCSDCRPIVEEARARRERAQRAAATRKSNQTKSSK